MEVYNEKILIVDAMNAFIRNYVMNPSLAADGAPIGGTKGFLMSLQKMSREINPDKIGRYTVGTKIPIVSEEEAKENADIFFVPNFGFRDMFVEKEKEFLEKGGRMIFAMPEVDVVTGDKK